MVGAQVWARWDGGLVQYYELKYLVLVSVIFFESGWAASGIY